MLGQCGNVKIRREVGHASLAAAAKSPYKYPWARLVLADAPACSSPQVHLWDEEGSAIDSFRAYWGEVSPMAFSGVELEQTRETLHPDRFTEVTQGRPCKMREEEYYG
ncbi:hypothetical protein PROFUN_08904 [Planoprotostelium fungivorum]|uniref:Uncharacterized protein n=1 Tax=Planoprotostelium fungivorum TaxID=1890364 RepID=A0A2P6NIT1_9EUKA|nr:hypothetical protein PROFUN_08904 [Planoprotostelium fungivorum]